MSSEKLLLVWISCVGDYDVGAQRKDVGVWKLWMTVQSVLVKSSVTNYVLDFNYVCISSLCAWGLCDLLSSHVRNLNRNISSTADWFNSVARTLQEFDPFWFIARAGYRLIIARLFISISPHCELLRHLSPHLIGMSPPKS